MGERENYNYIYIYILIYILIYIPIYIYLYILIYIYGATTFSITTLNKMGLFVTLSIND
jgi:hypothetical protein